MSRRRISPTEWRDDGPACASIAPRGYVAGVPARTPGYMLEILTLGRLPMTAAEATRRRVRSAIEKAAREKETA